MRGIVALFCLSYKETHTKETFIVTIMYFDDAGMVIATRDLQASHPWKVRESAKFKGRFYFFNLEDKSSAWSLPPSTVLNVAVNNSSGNSKFPPITGSLDSTKTRSIATTLAAQIPEGIASIGGSLGSGPGLPLGTSMDGGISLVVNNTQGQRKGMFTTGMSAISSSVRSGPFF